MDKKTSKFDLNVKFKKAIENKYLYKICKSLALPEDILMKNTTSLMDAAKEFENCSNCKGLECCKNSTVGYMLKAEKNNNGVIFSYVKCKYSQKDNYKRQTGTG